MPIHVCSANCQFILQQETCTYLCEESQYAHICGQSCTCREWDNAGKTWRCRLRNVLLDEKSESKSVDQFRVGAVKNHVLNFASTTARLVPLFVTEQCMRPEVSDAVNCAYRCIIQRHARLVSKNNTHVFIAILYSLADSRHDGVIPAMPKLKASIPQLSSIDRAKLKEKGFRMKHVTNIMRRLQSICTPGNE